ncbi:MAG: hypothetical protein J6P98_07405, partial [Clostridia bacterium]|nr:hypothetical protein [Clostridia bacterium]
MKKIWMISAMLLALLLAVSFSACTGGKDPEPTEAPATEAPATDAPEETAEAPTHEFDAALAGDWYGIFRVGDAGGKYRDNAGRSNDCAVRFAIGENGEGPFYCVINGLGDGAFGSCTARADMSGVTVEGNVAGEAVSWRFDLLSGKLLLSSLYGSG